MLGINYTYTNQLNLIGPDSIKFSVLHWTNITQWNYMEIKLLQDRILGIFFEWTAAAAANKT